MKSLILLFGEMGSGKSFIGKKMAAERGLTFVEGDKYVPDSMCLRVAAFRSISPDMIRLLIDNIKTYATHECLNSDNGIVLSQALYREEHRVELITFWEALGFNIEAHWVRPGLFQHARQLLSRDRGFRWMMYWLFNKPFFQSPKHKHTVNKNKRSI